MKIWPSVNGSNWSRLNKYELNNSKGCPNDLINFYKRIN